MMPHSASMQSLHDQTLTSKCIVSQILAALTGTIITLNLSAMTSAITIVNGALKVDPHSNTTDANFNATKDGFTITTAEASVYGTLQLFVHFVASVFAGVIQDMFGRRRCLFLSLIPQISSWLVLYFTANVHWLFAHAVLVGLSTALSEQTVVTYIGEVSCVQLRGRLFSISKLGYGFGSFFAFFLSTFMNWRMLAAVSCLLPLLVLILVLWLPESPLWLLSKGRVDQCRSSLRWLHGWTTDANIEREYLKLRGYVDISYKNSKGNGSRKQAKRTNTFQYVKDNYIKIFLQPEFVQPFKIVSVVFLASYFLSLRPAKFYFINTLNNLGVKTDQMKIMTVSSLAQIVGSITLALTVHKLGKRTLILWTFSATAVCLTLFGIYSLAHYRYHFDAVWILYILCGFLYYFGGYTLGGMPWFICAEIFPQKIRGVAGGITGTFAHILVSILTQTYLFVEETITVTNVFFLYAGISFVCCVYLYFSLPETENKSLQEIEEYFSNKNRKHSKIEDVSVN